MTTLDVNGRSHTVDTDPGTPILWALRDTLGMTGTKFGCGAALCVACTVHMDGQAVRSCVTPISAAEGKKITTIEAMTDGKDHVGAAVHAAWVKHDVAQCGYYRSRWLERCWWGSLEDALSIPARWQVCFWPKQYTSLALANVGFTPDLLPDRHPGPRAGGAAGEHPQRDALQRPRAVDDRVRPGPLRRARCHALTPVAASPCGSSRRPR